MQPANRVVRLPSGGVRRRRRCGPLQALAPPDPPVVASGPATLTAVPEWDVGHRGDTCDDVNPTPDSENVLTE